MGHLKSRIERLEKMMQVPSDEMITIDFHDGESCTLRESELVELLNELDGCSRGLLPVNE